MTTPTSLAKDIPEPIVFGPDFPRFKMLMRRGRQVFESRTNRNLFLDPIFDSDGEGTLTFARLLRHMGTWQDCLPLLVNEYWLDDTGQLENWGDWAEAPHWDESPSVELLTGYCRSHSQREFFLKYLATQHRVGLGNAFEEWLGVLRHQAATRAVGWMPPSDALGSENFVWRLINAMFDFPALIPEVWLNYVGYDKTSEDEAHLAENPQRVDFVLLAIGEKCVIEIDGPSHYADYDEQTGYTVSQERYAKNLAIERSLRRQGWGIYRFANLEVDRATSSKMFVRLVEDLPGFAADSYMGRPAFTAEFLSGVLGGHDRFLLL
jgi:hypothetical protein